MVYSLVLKRRQHSFAETSVKTLEQRRFYNLQIHSHYVSTPLSSRLFALCYRVFVGKIERQ